MKKTIPLLIVFALVCVLSSLSVIGVKHGHTSYALCLKEKPHTSYGILPLQNSFQPIKKR